MSQSRALPSRTGAAEIVTAVPQLSALARFRGLVVRYWFEEKAREAWLLTIGVIALVVITLAVQIGINRWNRFFFDALDRRDATSLYQGVALLIALALSRAAAAVTLMQIAAAFVQVQVALNWLVENAIRLAEWKASAQRVGELLVALAALDDAIGDDAGSTIVLGDSTDENIHILDLYSGSVDCAAQRQIDDQRRRRRHCARRIGSREGRIRYWQEYFDSRYGRTVALGLGPSPQTQRCADCLHASTALHPAWDIAQCS